MLKLSQKKIEQKNPHLVKDVGNKKLTKEHPSKNQEQS